MDFDFYQAFITSFFFLRSFSHKLREEMNFNMKYTVPSPIKSRLIRGVAQLVRS